MSHKPVPGMYLTSLAALISLPTVPREVHVGHSTCGVAMLTNNSHFPRGVISALFCTVFDKSHWDNHGLCLDI